MIPGTIDSATTFMGDKPPKGAAGEGYDPFLKGTTYRVYRFMLKQRKPVGISEIQKALSLSSSSVSEYHVKKLLQLGLIRQEQDGYVIDRVVVDNVIRIRRVAIPVQIAYVVFFSVTLLLFLMPLRPVAINSIYFLAVVVNSAALVVSLNEVRKTLKRL
jgi:DNA-binding transcriptional ArsR family regulator